MPYYAYKGRLLYFAAFKKHISLFIPTPILQEHKKDLKNYVTTAAAVHLSPHKRLPVPLVKKLIKARMKRNDAKSKKVFTSSLAGQAPGVLFQECATGLRRHF